MIRKPKGKIKNKSLAKRVRRHLSLRKKMHGTEECPRVSVTKSNKNLFVQVVDDNAGKTLFSVQTFGKNSVAGASCNKEGGQKIGSRVAELLKEKKIEKAVFDRGGFKYHGVVAAIADGIRENGITV